MDSMRQEPGSVDTVLVGGELTPDAFAQNVIGDSLANRMNGLVFYKT